MNNFDIVGLKNVTHCNSFYRSVIFDFSTICFSQIFVKIIVEMKKAQKIAENNAMTWKARGFKSTSVTAASESSETSSASHLPANSTHRSNSKQQDSSFKKSFPAINQGFKNSGTDSDDINRISLNHEVDVKKSQKIVENKTIPLKARGLKLTEGSPDHPQTLKKFNHKEKPKKKPDKQSTPKGQKKKKIHEGESSALHGEGNVEGKEKTEANNPKRKKQKFQGYNLFIGNLSYETTKEDILSHFAKCGPIKNVRIPMDKATNQPRGFGYIEVDEHVTYEVRRSVKFSCFSKAYSCFLLENFEFTSFFPEEKTHQRRVYFRRQ